MNALPALAGKAYVVLIVRTQMELPFPSNVIQMKAITVPMLLAENKALDPLDALRIIAITNGIPELVRLFDFQKSYAENLRLLFTQDSAYFRYAESELRRNFRTPETYNTLLYGMATGHNRISQLSEFSGFPQNKCDKYLKALDKAGLLESVQKKDAAGHVRTHYHPKAATGKHGFGMCSRLKAAIMRCRREKPYSSLRMKLTKPSLRNTSKKSAGTGLRKIITAAIGTGFPNSMIRKTEM